MTWKFLFATLAISAEHVQADYDMTFPPSVLGGRPQQYTIGTNYWIDSAVRVCSEGDGANTEQTDTNDLTVGSDYGGHASLPHTGKPVGVLIQDSQMDGYVSPPNGGQATGTAHTVLQIPAGSLTYPISINFPEAAQKIIWTYNIQTTHCGGLNGTSTVNYTLRMKKNMTRKEDSLSSNGKAKLVIERITNSHRDDAGYASTQTSAYLDALLEEYASCPSNVALPAGQPAILNVTAISLINGGLYDINRNWKPSHLNHRAGEDVDIGLASLSGSQAQLRCLYEAIDASGFSMPVPNESIIVSDPNTGEVSAAGDHVHLWSGESNFYPTDLLDVFYAVYICQNIGIPEYCAQYPEMQ